METWSDDPTARRRSFARACSHVIREVLRTSPELAGLQALDPYLRDEPPGTYRHDVTRWNLFVARLLAARGRPDLALPMTTRLGYDVEVSAWLLPALVWEGRLSLAIGDTTRAARAYRRAARLLSDPEPTFEPQAREIRNLARVLTDRSGPGSPTGD